MGYQNPPCTSSFLDRVNDKLLAIKCRLRQEQSLIAAPFNVTANYIIHLRAILLHYSCTIVCNTITITSVQDILFQMETPEMLYSPLIKQSIAEVKHFKAEEIPFSAIMKPFNAQLFLYSTVLLHYSTVIKYWSCLGKYFSTQIFSFPSRIFLCRATIP